MMTFGEIWKNGQRVMREFDAGTLTTIQQIVQQLYFTMCRQIALPALRRSIEMDFTSATNDGLPMPSNMAGIQAVVDESGHCRRIYYRTDESLKRVDDGRSHYYFRNIESPVLASGKISINQGGTIFTGDVNMLTDFTDEYIRFATEPGLFLLSAPATISTSYNGPQINNKLSIIGPPDTKRLCIVTPWGQRDGSKVMVYYWELPAPLYQDSDSILAILGLKLRDVGLNLAALL